MKKLMIILAAVLCLSLAPAPIVAEEKLVITCANSLELNQRLHHRLNQLKAIIERPDVKADDLWVAVFSVEIFALLDVDAQNVNWYYENCSES